MSALRRSNAVAVAVATCAVVTGAVAGRAAPVSAAGPQQAVIINAVVGPAEIDVYLDGALLVAGLDRMSASQPVVMPDRPEHDLVLFASVPNPPAARSARSDAPLQAGQLLGQPRPGAVAHPPGSAMLRLSNTAANGSWYVFDYDLPVGCMDGFATVSYEGASDLVTSIGGSSSGGIFASGNVTSGFGREYRRSVVVSGDRGSSAFAKPFTFGTFDFGEVPIVFGKDRFFVGYGAVGVTGASEIVTDCATGVIESVRNVARNPVFPSSRFVPLSPARVFDTRRAAVAGLPSGKLAPGAQVDVALPGRSGLPASGVTAVVLNVTATEASAPGFVTVWPTGAARPTTSNLNLLAPGQTAPNLVTVPLGAGGQVSFYSSGGTHLIADVAGYFVQAASATAGRLVPLSPARVVDTREPGPLNGVVGPDTAIRVPIAGSNGVPASGAGAVVLNVTGVGVGGPAFVTVHPGGTTRPEASNVNLAGVGDVTANLVMVPLGDDGSVEFYASDRAHVVADVFGYVTGAAAPASASGLFVPTTPFRVADTRPGPADVASLHPPLAAGEERTVFIAQVGDVPGVGAAAVLANVTGTGASAAGFITAWPSGGPVPGVSNVNLVGAGTTRPNAAIVPLGGPGDISLYSSGGTHALVDVFGYFTS